MLLADLVFAPEKAMAAVASRKAPAAAIALATLLAVVAAVVVTPRVEWAAGMREHVESTVASMGTELSQFEIEQAVSKAVQGAMVYEYIYGLLGPGLMSLGVAVAFWLAFRVVGSRPGFPECFSVAAWSRLPVAVASVLSIPAALTQGSLRPDEVGRLLPTSVGYFVPGLQGSLAEAAQAIDVFSMWAVALAALGMTHVTGLSRARAFVVVIALWLSYVGVFRMALARVAG